MNNKIVKLLLYCCLVPASAVPLALFGCGKSSAPPVAFIELFRVRPGNAALVPPSFGLGAPTNPFPSGVQGVLGPREKIFFGLTVNKEAKGPVTFSSYTYYRETPSVKSETPLATDELGPFNPGETPLVGIHNPWPVPTERGAYQLRVYLGDEVVASAIFEVSSEDQ